jgi:HlyD family secretion protein
MKKRIVPIIILALAGIAGAVVYRNIRKEPDNQIRFSGNIELTEVNIGFKTSGRISDLAVREGDDVKKGMVVARIDKDQLERQKDREVAGLAMAQSMVTQARTAAAWQKETWESELDARRADLRQAGERLRELEAGSRPQEIDEVKATVAAAQAEAERASKDWERAQQLYKQDDISTSQFDQFRSRNQAAQASLRQAQERLALVTEGPRKETIAAQRAVVARAKAALSTAEAQKLEVQRRTEEITTRQADAERSRAQVALLNTQIDDTVAVSPVDGVVLVKSADIGEIVAAGTTILKVGDIEHPWLRGYVPETALGRIKLGQKVRITTDSYPGKEYIGRISFIASEAEFTPKQIQTEEERVKLVYRIKVDVDNRSRELKSNMPADAVVLLEQE